MNLNNFSRLSCDLNDLNYIPESHWSSGQDYVFSIPFPRLMMSRSTHSCQFAGEQCIKDVVIEPPSLNRECFKLVVMCKTEEDMRMLLNGFQLHEDSTLFSCQPTYIVFYLDPTSEGIRKWEGEVQRVADYRESLERNGW